MNVGSDRAALTSFLASNSKNASENMRVLGSVSDPMYVGESGTSPTLAAIAHTYKHAYLILVSSSAVSVAKVHWWDRVAKALPYVFLIAGAYMIYTYQEKGMYVCKCTP